MTTDLQKVLRLQTWLSPAFPVGGYSYSHGLETAIDQGLVHDRASLRQWLETDLTDGAGRMDVVFLASAWRAVEAKDDDQLVEVATLSAAMRGTSELYLESMAQGRSFFSTVKQVWPSKTLSDAAALLKAVDIEVSLPVAFGITCAAEDIALEAAAAPYLQAQVANLVGAGVRCIPIGQTDGQRVIAALEPVIARVAREALSDTVDDIGSSSVMVDVLSMQHETQYTRIFRS